MNNHRNSEKLSKDKISKELNKNSSEKKHKHSKKISGEKSQKNESRKLNEQKLKDSIKEVNNSKSKHSKKISGENSQKNESRKLSEQKLKDSIKEVNNSKSKHSKKISGENKYQEDKSFSNLKKSVHERPDFTMECEIGKGILDIKEELAKFGFELDEDQVRKFEIHSLRLRQYSQIMNLSKHIAHDDIIHRHFLDSLIPLKYIELKPDENSKVVDIGTGAGFPGFPIAIYTGCQLTAIDSLSKRINFLQDVIDTADIENIELLHLRAEQLPKMSQLREYFDYCFFRAFADLSKIVEIAYPYIKKGGSIIAYKSKEIEEEMDAAFKLLLKYKLSIEKDILYFDSMGIERRVLVIKKL